jgi:hypothetical protein
VGLGREGQPQAAAVCGGEVGAGVAGGVQHQPAAIPRSTRYEALPSRSSRIVTISAIHPPLRTRTPLQTDAPVFQIALE